ncbi:MAG: hypothetical protein GC153_02105 [Alphaproteobacteria bacterium]|nr:hypothetical protein [Alphaproteobacteria bacterium]
MRKSILACVAAAALAATGASAAGVASGIGINRCGDLYNAYATASAGGQQALIIAVGQWAYGYMTGRNSEQPKANWKDLGALDVDSGAGLVLKQCASHPSLYVIEVVDAIYDALPYANVSS